MLAANYASPLSLVVSVQIQKSEKIMELGCFSISLTVTDLKKSKAFYEKIGFEVFAGEESHNFLIMKNGDTNIGLFQGMFEKNILTFNPGWNQNAENVESFSDVRKLRKQFKSQGIEIVQDFITEETGPSSFSIVDPDGNMILIDQHV
jgi:predicted lactoylglutathione lyase